MAPSRRIHPGGRRDSRDSRRPHQERRENAEIAESISATLGEIIASQGLYLEVVKIGRGGKNPVARVIVDLSPGPGGVDSDRLTEVSRGISQRLDDIGLVQGTYTPEIPTPGAERSLRKPRYFSRAQGRLVELRTVDGKSVVGRFVSLSSDALSVQIEGSRRNVPMAEVVSGHVKIDIGRTPQSTIEEGED